MNDHRYDAAIAAGKLIDDMLLDLARMPEHDRLSNLTFIILEGIYAAEVARIDADVSDRLQSWANMAAAEIINLYGDGPPSIRFQKIAGTIVMAMGHAHREEREAILSVLDN